MQSGAVSKKSPGRTGPAKGCSEHPQAIHHLASSQLRDRFAASEQNIRSVQRHSTDDSVRAEVCARRSKIDGEGMVSVTRSGVAQVRPEDGGDDPLGVAAVVEVEAQEYPFGGLLPPAPAIQQRPDDAVEMAVVNRRLNVLRTGLWRRGAKGYI